MQALQRLKQQNKRLAEELEHAVASQKGHTERLNKLEITCRKALNEAERLRDELSKAKRQLGTKTLASQPFMQSTVSTRAKSPSRSNSPNSKSPNSKSPNRSGGTNTSTKQANNAGGNRAASNAHQPPSKAAAHAQRPNTTHTSPTSAAANAQRPSTQPGGRAAKGTHQSPQDQQRLQNRKHAAAEQPNRCTPLSKGEIAALFREFDYNGNGMLSLAEIDKAVTVRYPQYNHKAVMMRAYKWADADQNGFITKREFGLMLRSLAHFEELWEKFDAVDTGNDRRIDFEEFAAALPQMGMQLSNAQARQMFEEIDENGGGQILFDEFCTYFARLKASESDGTSSAAGNRASSHSLRGEPCHLDIISLIRAR